MTVLSVSVRIDACFSVAKHLVPINNTVSVLDFLKIILYIFGVTAALKTVPEQFSILPQNFF